jgi:acid phosphatase type 7
VGSRRTRWIVLALLLAATLFTPLLAGGRLAPSASAGPLAASAADPVVAAAGDIACDPTSSSFNGGNGSTNNCRQKATSDLLLDPSISSVLLLGDNQYYCGGYQAWLQSYDKSWGRVKGITRPAPGNHEYLTSGGTDCNSANANAAGYFRYFGAAAGDPAKGYYSYDVGSWHFIVLNSECTDVGGCSATSPQGVWLREDLAAHTNYCTLAYWHIPLFSSGGRASSRYRTFWDALYAADADIVLNGHDHIYERFAPQRPDGTADSARGIREFVVGTGGSNHTSLSTVFANSQVRNTSTYGVLRLTLHPQGYDWRFVPEAGKTFNDSGSGACHGSTPPPPDTTPPTTPSGLTATATGSRGRPQATTSASPATTSSGTAH